jgi:hypothetical protein
MASRLCRNVWWSFLILCHLSCKYMLIWIIKVTYATWIHMDSIWSNTIMLIQCRFSAMSTVKILFLRCMLVGN